MSMSFPHQTTSWTKVGAINLSMHDRLVLSSYDHHTNKPINNLEAPICINFPLQGYSQIPCLLYDDTFFKGVISYKQEWHNTSKSPQWYNVLIKVEVRGTILHCTGRHIQQCVPQRMLAHHMRGNGSAYHLLAGPTNNKILTFLHYCSLNVAFNFFNNEAQANM